jgi:hypothetical protein
VGQAGKNACPTGAVSGDKTIMSQAFASRLRWFAGVAAALLLFGCGGGGKGGVKVEGKIVKNGQAVKVEEGMTLSLGFAGTDAKGGAAVFPAAVSSDGTFVAEHVLPGKYKIRVGLGGGSNDPKGLAKLKELNKPFEAASESLEYDVTGDSGQRITVDVGTGKAAKQ